VLTLTQGGARWPDRIHELTDRPASRPVEYIAHQINAFVHGWAGYFRFVCSTYLLEKITAYVKEWMALFACPRHKQGAPLRTAMLIASGNALA
jgi:Group II intron, maturase-specific domain